MNTTLITGATGNVGAEIIHLMHAAGHPLRAAVRDPRSASARLDVAIE
jgi:uncharacterized protein YbjT (DUF2867 family)